MGTINDKTNYLIITKNQIKQAIISKGQNINDNDTFRSYVEKIENIETGIDTSDATATANDIVINKTAYVNGQKIEGVIPIAEYVTADPDTVQATEYSDLDLIIMEGKYGYEENRIIVKETNISVALERSMLANVLGITPDKVANGKYILGVKGTG